jgi:hypothetical protein
VPQANIQNSIKKQKQKFLNMFNNTLKECQEKEVNVEGSKRKRNKNMSLTNKQGSLKSNDLLFAFNQDNKYKAARKIKPYTNFERIPSGKPYFVIFS